MWYETPPPEDPPPEDPPPEEPAPLDEPTELLHPTGPDQLVRDQRIPFDHARGIEFLSGEVPPGWNEPLP